MASWHILSLDDRTSPSKGIPLGITDKSFCDTGSSIGGSDNFKSKHCVGYSGMSHGRDCVRVGTESNEIIMIFHKNCAFD